MRPQIIKLCKILLKLATPIPPNDWVTLYDAYEVYLDKNSRMYDKQKFINMLDAFVNNFIEEVREDNDIRLRQQVLETGEPISEY